MTEGRIDGFFYGLFMDSNILRDSEVVPTNPRRAYVDGFALRIGRRATLVPSSGARAYGMVYSLTRTDFEKLYKAPGLEDYRPEAILAHSMEGGAQPALCYNLPKAPESDEINREYAERLRAVLDKLEFPSGYIASIP